MPSEFDRGEREAELSARTQPPVPVQHSSARPHITPHVIRYVSAHASTWPEYIRTQRTLDRSRRAVRCKSLERPFSATAVTRAVNLLPTAERQRTGLTEAERPVRQWSSRHGEQWDRPRRLTCGTTLSWSHIHCCVSL